MAPLAKKLNKKSDGKFNYADYLTWPDDERWEIIEGVVYDMTPAPSTEHQGISFKLSGILYDFLKDKKCKAFAAYKDQTEKLLLYEKHDVKEYWIVNPDAKYVMIYRFSIPDPFCSQTKYINQDLSR